ncbi:hypothetical protein ACWDO7_23015 [Streptomyces sp. NPDC003656]
MPEIAPDLTNKFRCVSVHWSLPVQCELPPGHREVHEATHPVTGRKIRYRRSGGVWRTEEWTGTSWRRLEIVPPGGYCGQRHPEQPHLACTWQYGHSLSRPHAAEFGGEWVEWDTQIPEPGPREGLRSDSVLRGVLFDQDAELRRLRELLAAEQDNELVRLREFAQTTQNRHVDVTVLLARYDLMACSEDAWDLGMSVLAALEGPQRPGGTVDVYAELEKLQAAIRQRRLLAHLKAVGEPTTSGQVHTLYMRWGWRKTKPSHARDDLNALADAGLLVRDDSDPGIRLFRLEAAVVSAGTGGAS